LNVFNLAMERPTAKAQRTREQILATSLALFREQGFDHTSMRDIAEAAGVSLGSTYYYFPSKEALVFAFYARTQAAAEARSAQTLRTTVRFRERLHDVVLYELEQLAEYRSFVVVLARSALDPSRPLSPFSAETRHVREGAIEILRCAVQGSDVKVHRRLAPHLPRLLWLFQMAIIFFWLHDASPGQARTHRVVDAGLALLERLLMLSALPGAGKLVSLIVGILEELSFWESGLARRES